MLAKMNFNPDPDRKMRPRLYQTIKQEYENFTAEELEKFIPRNGGLSDFGGLFFNSLQVEKMGVLIDKK